MEHLKRLIRTTKAANEVVGFVTSELVKPWLYPAAAAAVTTLSAVLTAVPLPYLLTGAFVSAAAAATAMVRVDEWRERTSPSGGLALLNLLNALDLGPDNNPNFLKSIQIGLIMRSTASFPLHYVVERFDVQVMGRVATETWHQHRPVEVMPGDVATYRDFVIQVQAPLLNEVETGRLRFRVAYWKSERRKYYVERSLRLYLRRDSETGQLDLNSTIE